MLNNLQTTLKKHWQVALAITLALLVLVIYLLSGRANLDQNLKSIQSSPQVTDVQINQSSQGETLATIECENGNKYEVYIPANETDFAALKASKCN